MNQALVTTEQIQIQSPQTTGETPVLQSHVLAQFDALKSTDKRFEKINSSASAMADEVSAALYWGAMDYFRQNGFVWVDVPILTKITGACENVDTLYKVDHFGREAYLAQTGQLYLEAKIPIHKKVCTVITSSRAEAEVDGRHLNQFQLLEFEQQGDFESMLTHVEGTIKSMFSNALATTRGQLRALGRDTEELARYVSEPFGRVTYTQAINMLKGTPLEVAWGSDLKAGHEAAIVKMAGNKPTFITHYPKAIKFFNMRQNRENPLVVNSADLILPFAGEAVGSSEREDDPVALRQRLLSSPMFQILSKRGVTISEFDDYLKTVTDNPILHSGCGIGFSRVAQCALGASDIRQATSYPLNAETLY